jgi:hypothetical protein
MKLNDESILDGELEYTESLPAMPELRNQPQRKQVSAPSTTKFDSSIYDDRDVDDDGTLTVSYAFLLALMDGATQQFNTSKMTTMTLSFWALILMRWHWEQIIPRCGTRCQNSIQPTLMERCITKN